MEFTRSGRGKVVSEVNESISTLIGHTLKSSAISNSPFAVTICLL